MPYLLWLLGLFVAARYYRVSELLGAIYPITLSFAGGLWLVIWRYRTIRDRAVPFHLKAPPVCYSRLSDLEKRF